MKYFEILKTPWVMIRLHCLHPLVVICKIVPLESGSKCYHAKYYQQF